MQIRSKYLLISTKRKTRYFEVRGYINFGVMRIRDYTSQDPKVLIECHRHHGFIAGPEGRPESLAHSPTRATSQSPEFYRNWREFGMPAGVARVAMSFPVPCALSTMICFRCECLFQIG